MNMNIGTVTAIITAIIAALVAIITWRQWVTNRARLKHELFDRRYTIYEQVAAFIADVLQKGRIAPGGDTEFLRKTKKAYFAFGGDERIKELISEIYKRAVDLHTLQAEEIGLDPDARHQNIEKQREIKEWYDATLANLESIFGEYLKLGH